MRAQSVILATLVAAACADPTPTATFDNHASLSVGVQGQGQGDGRGAAPVVFNTQLRSSLEVPACASSSIGHAHLAIQPDGTIDAQVILNNKGDESVRFGHIHHLNPGEATGPIIWWLTAPVGVDLDLTERHIDVRQAGTFVSNPHFTTEQEALDELLSDPGSFYVNFHSDACPGGFARGFLP